MSTSYEWGYWCHEEQFVADADAPLGQRVIHRPAHLRGGFDSRSAAIVDARKHQEWADGWRIVAHTHPERL